MAITGVEASVFQKLNNIIVNDGSTINVIGQQHVHQIQPSGHIPGLPPRPPNENYSNSGKKDNYRSNKHEKNNQTDRYPQGYYQNELGDSERETHGAYYYHDYRPRNSELAWQRISSIQAQVRHKAALKKVTAGTGPQLHQWSEYNTWLEPPLGGCSRSDQGQVMWGYGIPGAGKTTFASIVIDEVECHAQGLTSTACVAYFYFRYDDYPAPTLEDVLEVLIKQTVEQHSVICRPIFDKVYDRHRGGTQPTEKELLRLMTNIARRIVIAFFFLDALDEAISEIQASLVQKLTSVGPNVKLFVTSRPQTVEAHFSDAFHFEIYAQDRDLDLHIADAVSRSVELQDIFRLADTAWREKIVSTIKGKCGKMFLHASLQLQALQESVSMHDVEQTLESIPTGIEEFYGWTMARIRKQGGKKPSLASSVLLWVLHATRPLTANEMEYVVAMCPKTHKFDKKRVVPLATLTRLCQGLVEIEDTSRNVRLVHYTAQKALENLMAEDRVVYERESHQQLAEICMGHLANFRFQNTALNSKEALEEAVQANTLLPYVLNSWAIHAIKSLPVDPTSAAKRSVEKFVQGCLAYPVILSFSGAFDVLGPLHTAVYFGLPIAFAGNLGNPNLPSRHQGLTPLSLAGLQNSQTTMKELLALPHILVNASGHGGQTALVAVSKAGQYDAATLLLADPRISVNQADENGWTPLIVASALGQVAVATRLLGHPSIEVNRADNFRKTPLIWASQKGEEQIVRLLLDQRKTKISINARDEDGLTALESAMFYNHKPVYNLLLPHPGTEIESSILAQVSSRFRIRHLLGRPAPGSSTTWKQRMGWMDEEYQKAGAFIGKPGDLVILVVGPTGAGKSAFIKELTGDDSIALGHDQMPCTHDMASYLAPIPQEFVRVLGERRLLLVDTPGTVNGIGEDSKVFRAISIWLAQLYNKEMVVAGLVYMQHVDHFYRLGVKRSDFSIFTEICGGSSLKVVLATSQWDRNSLGDERREQNPPLSKFWADIIAESGARIMDIHHKPADQQAIISYLLHTFSKEGYKDTCLQIQKELVDDERGLPGTRLGQEILRRQKTSNLLLEGSCQQKHKYYSYRQIEAMTRERNHKNLQMEAMTRFIFVVIVVISIIIGLYVEE